MGLKLILTFKSGCDKMPLKDRIARLEYHKKYNKIHYANNKKYYLNKNKKLIKQCVKWFKQYKSSLKCSRCSENDPVCLDFHHSGGSKKEYIISKMIYRGYSIKKILNEINKCIVLCSNCHRKEHKKDYQ